MTRDDLVEVRLLELPLLLHERLQAHTDGLLREFRLLRQQSEEPGTDLPRRLLELVRVLTEQYDGVGDEQDDLCEQALARGSGCSPSSCTSCRARLAQACSALRQLLDEADVYCAAGQHLLMLATPPELVATAPGRWRSSSGRPAAPPRCPGRRHRRDRPDVVRPAGPVRRRREAADWCARAQRRRNESPPRSARGISPSWAHPSR